MQYVLKNNRLRSLIRGGKDAETGQTVLRNVGSNMYVQYYSFHRAYAAFVIQTALQTADISASTLCLYRTAVAALSLYRQHARTPDSGNFAAVGNYAPVSRVTRGGGGRLRVGLCMW